VQDFRLYLEQFGAHQDGPHGFIYSFLSAFYRFEQHAKLYERRFNSGQLTPQETAIPPSVEQILEYALAVAREKPPPTPPVIRIDTNAKDAAEVVWSGPLYDPAAYGEEVRNLLLHFSSCANWFSH
jgi:hypothetical protein